jgi:hypothetical protein
MAVTSLFALPAVRRVARMVHLVHVTGRARLQKAHDDGPSTMMGLSGGINVPRNKGDTAQPHRVTLSWQLVGLCHADPDGRIGVPKTGLEQSERWGLQMGKHTQSVRHWTVSRKLRSGKLKA